MLFYCEEHVKNNNRWLSIRLATLGFLFALSAVAPQASSAKPQWQMLALKNGLQVIVVENTAVPLVTVEIAVKNGAWTEPPEYNGLSHLYEHMFFKSNERSRAQGYNDQAAELGMLSNAQTHEEVVNYYTTTIRSGAREAMKIMRDSLRYPLFDKQELDQEIQVVLDELNQHRSNPFFYLLEGVDRRLWYKYFSRKTPGGDPATVAKATPEMMRTIQAKFYLPNNSALVVAGDVNAADVFKAAEELFGDWPRGADPFAKDPVPRHPALSKDEAVIVNQPVNAATIQMSWHGPSTDLDAPATYAADVFSFILRQADSKFAKALVDTGLVTGADLSYLTQKNVGPITFRAQTTADKLKAALKAVNAEIVRFDAPDYFSDEELESAKTLLDVNEVYTREKASDFAHTISFWWASSGLDYYSTYIENLNKVTRADIKTYVNKYIKGKHRVAGVLMSAQDQQRIGLSEQDLLQRDDSPSAVAGATGRAATPAGKPAAGKPVPRPRPATKPKRK
jgi:zinc protease